METASHNNMNKEMARNSCNAIRKKLFFSIRTRIWILFYNGRVNGVIKGKNNLIFHRICRSLPYIEGTRYPELATVYAGAFDMRFGAPNIAKTAKKI